MVTRQRRAVVMAVAAGWEIFEFAGDRVFGGQAQHGEVDTMTDMIAGTLGGVVTLVVARGLRLPRRHPPQPVDVG